jgi:hypothetical protein
MITEGADRRRGSKPHPGRAEPDIHNLMTDAAISGPNDPLSFDPPLGPPATRGNRHVITRVSVTMADTRSAGVTSKA